LGKFVLENPLVLASGIVGVTTASLSRAIESGAGAAVSKSIGLEPREGYKNPTLVGTDCGLLNAVGLAELLRVTQTEEHLAALVGDQKG
jgi:dihydroorotate dehydrogenase (NAD+) catalytic subunit